MPLITISRGIGCGGEIIARMVSNDFKLELYDDHRLQEEAVEMGIRSEDLKGLDEKVPGLFDRLLSKKPAIYMDLMEAVVYEVARRGNGVILGHGSQMLLHDFGCALHVFICANESSRINNLMIQRGLSRKTAKKLIHKKDQEKKGFFRYVFHAEWNDPALYDLMINTEKIGIDSASKLIMEAAQLPEIKKCSTTALDTMERLSLKKRIHATILKSGLNSPILDVEVPEKGVAEIRGWTYTGGEKERLLEIVKGVPGISEVRSNVYTVPECGGIE